MSLINDSMGGITSLVREGPSGTAVSRLGLTRTGGQLTSVRDTVSGRNWNYTYVSDGSLEKDGNTGYYFADNMLGLLAQTGTPISHSPDYNLHARVIYLADGTKLEAGLEDGPSILYRGSFSYSKTAAGAISLESISVPGGMILV